MPGAAELCGWVREARERTLELFRDLDGPRLLGPRLSIVNPPLWEVAHVAWFQSRWALRHAAGEPPVRPDEDSLYDSIAIPHAARWGLPLPSKEDTVRYLEEVRDRVCRRLESGAASPQVLYHALYTTLHEDMHGEAFLYTRQTLGYPLPALAAASPDPVALHAGPHPGDARVPGGKWLLGSAAEEPFVFDNEKWAHPVELEPFSIARAPVTQEEFRAFVEDGGYRRRELWSEAGWVWREEARAEAPLHWRRAPGARGGTPGWERRVFERWVPLEPHRPVIHVSWHEAQAYCAWAGRRLPTEAEWEAAAAGEPAPDGQGLSGKRRYPWGDEPPGPERANLDARLGGTAGVAAFPQGDSAFGCRQMLGNVWEWTASDFLPFPGFTPDPYREYSEPWFGSARKVLRGGSWPTRSRLIRIAYRNFYTADRRDVWAGFRTCAPG